MLQRPTGFSLRNFAPLGSYFRDELFFPGTRVRDVEGDSVLCLQFYGAWAWAPMWQCSSASAASPTPKNSRPSSFSFLRFFPPLGPPSSWPWADAGMALVLIAPPHVCSWTDSSGEGFHPDTVLSPNPKSDPPSFFRPKVSQRRNPGAGARWTASGKCFAVAGPDRLVADLYDRNIVLSEAKALPKLRAWFLLQCGFF